MTTRFFALALAVSAAFTGVSFAQEGSEEIIITAQRREQSAQDVGLAVSVLSGQELLERGVRTVNGLENITPSLEVEQQFGGGQPSFTLRGVGFRDYASNNSPTVGVYVDDVAYTLPIMTQGVLFDLARVEVLRGPQGTLYGRNTTGGAINVISARPTDDFQIGTTLEYGNYNAFRGEGYVSGPLGGGAAGRLSIASAQGGAWQVNRETGEELGDADRLALRGQLSVPIGERLDVLLNVHGFSDDSDGLGLQIFKTNGSGFAPHLGQRQTSWGSSAEFAADNGISTTTAPFRDNAGIGASINARYDFGPASLTYIGAVESLDRTEFNDWDAAPTGIAGVFFSSIARVTSHELRLASNGDNRFDWITGLYYSAEDLDEEYNSDFVDSFGAGFSVSTPYEQETRTLGVFGQVEYQATERLNLIAGLRYEDETRDLIDLGTFANAFGAVNLATCTTPFDVGTCTEDRIDRSTSLNEVTGRLAAEFRASEDVLLYGSISRGIKSGGFTAYNTLAPAALNPFEPEELIAYEIGFRSDLFDNRLRLNGAAYYYDYSNQQVQGAIFVGGFVIGQIQNVPESEIWGAELELSWRPTDRLTIDQAIGYAQGEFTRGSILNTAAPPAQRNLAGVRIGFPEVSYSGAISYTAPLTASGWAWTGTFDYSYRGDTDPPLLQPVSGEGYGVDAYWLANASVGFRPPTGNWEFSLWGRNIFDEDYEETRNFFAGADFTPLSAPGMPATYGIRLSVRN